jgi:hypothetical protein
VSNATSLFHADADVAVRDLLADGVLDDDERVTTTSVR